MSAGDWILLFWVVVFVLPFLLLLVLYVGVLFWPAPLLSFVYWAASSPGNHVTNGLGQVPVQPLSAIT